MRKFVAGCLTFGALFGAQCAAAADLSVAPLYKAPPAQATPAYNWSGFYVGANGGGGWGHSYWDANATGMNLSGAQAGGTAGYNWQAGNAVFGLEGDLDWSNLKGSATLALCPSGCNTSDTWLSTVRGRAGYAFGGILPYLTGGLAVGDIRAGFPGFATASATNAGWTGAAASKSRCPELVGQGRISPRRPRPLRLRRGLRRGGNRQRLDARQCRARRPELSLRLG